MVPGRRAAWPGAARRHVFPGRDANAHWGAHAASGIGRPKMIRNLARRLERLEDPLLPASEEPIILVIRGVDPDGHVVSTFRLPVPVFPRPPKRRWPRHVPGGRRRLMQNPYRYPPTSGRFVN